MSSPFIDILIKDACSLRATLYLSISVFVFFAKISCAKWLLHRRYQPPTIFKNLETSTIPHGHFLNSVKQMKIVYFKSYL